MTELTCAAGCGKTYKLNDYQQAAINDGTFRSWTCADCFVKYYKKEDDSERSDSV